MHLLWKLRRICKRVCSIHATDYSSSDIHQYLFKWNYTANNKSCSLALFQARLFIKVFYVVSIRIPKHLIGSQAWYSLSIFFISAPSVFLIRKLIHPNIFISATYKSWTVFDCPTFWSMKFSIHSPNTSCNQYHSIMKLKPTLSFSSSLPSWTLHRPSCYDRHWCTARAPDTNSDDRPSNSIDNLPARKR